jgi:hypothetical protein
MARRYHQLNKLAKSKLEKNKASLNTDIKTNIPKPKNK